MIIGGIWTLLSIGPWSSFIVKLFGLPGYIDDAAKWYQWVTEVMDYSLLYYPALAVMTVTGPALLTYDWWRPRLSRWRGRAPAVDDTMAARFRDLAPLLQRHMAGCRPLIARAEGYDVSDGYQADYVELVGKLEGLGVGYPLVNSNTKVWYQYLVVLNELVETGQLVRAQQQFGGVLLQG